MAVSLREANCASAIVTFQSGLDEDKCLTQAQHSADGMDLLKKFWSVCR